MNTGVVPGVFAALPKDVWEVLSNDKNAVFIDVRTRAEWAFVGKPDLSDLEHEVHCIEWAEFPDMSVNPNFVATVFECLGGSVPSQAFFLCRSGVRSLSAAKAVAASAAERGLSFTCVNVLEGFEGDLDSQTHRGSQNGWKARGLPWRQS